MIQQVQLRGVIGVRVRARARVRVRVRIHIVQTVVEVEVKVNVNVMRTNCTILRAYGYVSRNQIRF